MTTRYKIERISDDDRWGVYESTQTIIGCYWSLLMVCPSMEEAQERLLVFRRRSC